MKSLRTGSKPAVRNARCARGDVTRLFGARGVTRHQTRRHAWGETERSEDMRRSYKYLYHAAPIPLVRATAQYDPVRTYEARRGVPSRLRRQRARLRRARIAERWIVRTVASLLAIAMLPVLVVAEIIMLAIALRRRYARGREWRRTPVTIDGTRIPHGACCRRHSRELREPCSPGLPDVSTCERYARAGTHSPRRYSCS